MLLRSYIITAIRRVIIPSTTPSQKTSDSLDNPQKPCNAILCPVQGDKTKILTNVGNKKIDGLVLKTYKKIITGISL